MKTERSKVEKAQVTCDHCGKQFSFTMYPVLNLSEFPKLRAKVMDASIFVPKCPHCRSMNNVSYPMTCSDPARNMIVCMAGSEEEYQQTLRLYEEGSIYSSMMAYINTDGEMRLVRTPLELAEKFCIAQAQKDDMVMELMKFHLLERLKETIPGSDHLWFLLHGKKQYLLVSKEKKLYELAYQDSWYQEAARAYSPYLKDMEKKPIVIDEKWAEQMLRPVKVDEPESAVGFQ